MVKETISELFKKAKKLAGTGYDQKAHTVINKILKKDPRHLKAMLLKADLYINMQNTNKMGKARALMANALELDPNNVKILTLLAKITMRHNYKQANLRAMKLIDKAIEIKPQSNRAWEVKGMIYYHLKDMEGAERSFLEAIRLNPNNRGAKSNLTNVRIILAQTRARTQRKKVKVPKGTPNFLNPKIRRDKFAKQLGFDPIAFVPITEENMIYIHMDGNENNDDPEMHAWISKESYEQLKGEKVDIKFAQNEEEAQSKIDEWEEEQKSRKTELDSMVEKRIFPSWSFMVQPDYEETPDGNRIQLTSPGGNRSITVSSLTLEGQATPEIIAGLGEKYEQAGLKKKSDIKHKDYTGLVFENDQYAHMGTFVIQCIIAAPSRLLMLTFSFVDTKEDKKWALNVINTVKYYKH